MSQAQAKNAAFKVDYTSYTDVTREATEPEYDRDDTSTSHTLQSVELVEDNRFNCVGAFDAVPGETVYVVSATYSTGDSFGHDAGSGLEFVAVFKTLEKAERCRQQLQAHTDIYQMLNRCWRENDPNEEARLLALNSRLAEPLKSRVKKVKGVTKTVIDPKTFEGFSAKYQDERDEVHTLCPPWLGYFESLDSLSVDAFLLQPVQTPQTKTRPRMRT
jgi:hypothetical protein